jgi:hypothetical protein
MSHCAPWIAQLLCAMRSQHAECGRGTSLTEKKKTPRTRGALCFQLQTIPHYVRGTAWTAGMQQKKGPKARAPTLLRRRNSSGGCRNRRGVAARASNVAAAGCPIKKEGPLRQ